MSFWKFNFLVFNSLTAQADLAEYLRRVSEWNDLIEISANDAFDMNFGRKVFWKFIKHESLMMRLGSWECVAAKIRISEKDYPFQRKNFTQKFETFVNLPYFQRLWTCQHTREDWVFKFRRSSHLDLVIERVLPKSLGSPLIWCWSRRVPLKEPTSNWLSQSFWAKITRRQDLRPRSILCKFSCENFRQRVYLQKLAELAGFNFTQTASCLTKNDRFPLRRIWLNDETVSLKLPER